MAHYQGFRGSMLAGVAFLAFTAGSATYAQPTNVTPEGQAKQADGDATDDATPVDDATPRDPSEIVVTGTIIRGIAPPGANQLSVSREAAELTGATDSQQLINTLPQSSTFMAFQNPGSGVAQGVSRVPINLPNLRNLPSGATGNPTTLVMLDGHRIVPSGIEQSAVDVGIIPTPIVERTEIILDGVSALYGSDAHGGVINFISRKRFDEVKVAARYGFADNYWSFDAEATGGFTWDGGGFGVTYGYAENTPLFNKDRPERIARNFVNPNVPGAPTFNPNLPIGPLTGTACEDHATITTGTGAAQRTFSANSSGTITSGATNCGSNAFTSFVNGQVRHGALATFSQDLTDKIKLEVTGLYSHRQATVFFGPFTGTQTVRSTPSGTAPANPYFRSLSAFGVADTSAQTISFSYGPVLGTDAQRGVVTSELWQITPTLSVDIGSWQVRALASYGESTVRSRVATLNTTAQAVMFSGASTATTNNPYNLAASTNLAQIRALVYDSVREGRHKFLQLRLTADGPLFTLPGGEVRAAVGAEYVKTKFAQVNTIAPSLATPTPTLTAPIERSTAPKAVFAELNVPIFGAENAMPGFQSLVLSASGRYDDYGQFGTTFNPKIGLTWEPTDWVTLRGNWGTSFRAPTAVNLVGGAANSLSCSGATSTEAGCLSNTFFFILPPGGPNPPPGTVGLALIGSREDLKPETSKNWSIGADFRPIQGLTISPTYYHIDLENVINIPSTGANGRLDLIYLGAPQLVTLNPTAAQLQAFAALAPTNGSSIIQAIANNGYTVAYIADTRTQNLGGSSVSGIDLKVNYFREVGFGSVDFSFNGTWRLQDDAKFFATSPVTDNLATGVARFSSSTTLGMRTGGLRAQVTWQHLSGYPLLAAANRSVSQTATDAFDLYNLALRYDFDEEHRWLGGTQLTLTVNNIFDTQPQLNLTTTGGTINGQTLGRFIQFGISKSFGFGRSEAMPAPPPPPPLPEPAYTPPPAPAPAPAPPPPPPPPAPGERG